MDIKATDISDIIDKHKDKMTDALYKDILEDIQKNLKEKPQMYSLDIMYNNMQKISKEFYEFEVQNVVIPRVKIIKNCINKEYCSVCRLEPNDLNYKSIHTRTLFDHLNKSDPQVESMMKKIFTDEPNFLCERCECEDCEEKTQQDIIVQPNFKIQMRIKT